MKICKPAALLLITALLLQLFPAAAADTASLSEAAADKEAAAVLSYVIGDSVLNGETVTRGEFTYALMHTLSLGGGSFENVFSDVKEDTPYAAEICSALKSGIISPDSSFEPDSPILFEQAVKMVVCALKYQDAADYMGGYPYGYINAANRIELLKKTDQSMGMMTAANVRRILYNLLMSKFRYTGIQNNTVKFETVDKDYLTSIYGLSRVEGTVTATKYNSYRSDSGISGKPFIEIDGIAYSCDEIEPDYLGRHVVIYTDNETGGAELIIQVNNYEETVEKRDLLSLSNGRLIYYDENEREKSLNVSGAQIVYNGRKVTSFSLADMTGDNGSLRLLDNDDDNVFEYIFVTDETYMLISSADKHSGFITDSNGEDPVLLNKTDSAVIILSENGEQLEISDLKAGDLAVKTVSKDKKLTTLKLCGTKITGTVNEKRDDDKIVIDQEEYYISAYAKKYYAALLETGSTGTFITGNHNNIVIVSSAGGMMRYGYLVNAKTAGRLDPMVLIKIFTQQGELKVFRAEKVYFDSETTSVKEEKILDALGGLGNVTPRLIRFCTDASGEMITRIDLAETDFDFTKKPDSDTDSLRKYIFTGSGGGAVTKFNYRSGGLSCAPYFNLYNTIIMSVPADANVNSANESEFEIGTVSDLTSSSNYSFEIYDMNDTGSAGVAILKGTAISSKKDYIIERVSEGILPDGGIGTVIDVYGSQQYRTFYLSDSAAAGKTLCPGDIVELSCDEDDSVKKITVIFDASSGLPVPNPSSGASFENANGITYFYGALYSADGTYAYLSKTVDGNGGFSYGFSDLINLKLKTGNMVLINKKRNELRPVTMGELRDYKTCGGDNYYIVVRESYQSPTSVYVYER